MPPSADCVCSQCTTLHKRDEHGRQCQAPQPVAVHWSHTGQRRADYPDRANANQPPPSHSTHPPTDSECIPPRRPRSQLPPPHAARGRHPQRCEQCQRPPRATRIKLESQAPRLKMQLINKYCSVDIEPLHKQILYFCQQPKEYIQTLTTHATVETKPLSIFLLQRKPSSREVMFNHIYFRFSNQAVLTLFTKTQGVHIKGVHQ